MKLTKSLFLAFAGLGLFACSNEDLNEGNNLQGNGVVEVKIVSPSDMSRALVNGTGGQEGAIVLVKGTITVKLTAESGDQTATITQDAINGGQHTVKFWDVKKPSKIEAYINGGDQVIDGVSIVAGTPNMQAMPENIPAYGSTTDIKLNGEIETHENSGGVSKDYEMYKATVEMKIPVARLEVSGICHKKHVGEPDDVCEYKKLTINGIYLDKIYATKGAKSVTDYHYPEVKDAEDATLIPAPILWTEITEHNSNFMNQDVKWPAVAGEGENQQVYAFNFFPGAMPILKIYFAEAESSDPTIIKSKPRYAVIKSYNGKESFNFEAGKIYRLTDVTLSDKNILGDEEGNNLYGVDVTVKEATWSVTGVTGEWIEQ
ncbi:hypothetical protein [Phocaeicola plebeius]|uniref:hypothetical protein n=1 Tax=Phocaeicola plebeius TaxID=310297 RepID=UPI0026ED155B|nr:hypothetical protein [Phocaeicola plebeius]